MSRTLLRFAGVIALGLASLPGSGVAQTPSAPDCAAPPDLLQDDPHFPELARRIKAKVPVTIVVLGGSSTVGAAAGGGDAAYPHQLERALRRRYPGVAITVVNKGAPRETAKAMAARLERDVIAQKPVLAIWEVGVTDAVRGTDLDDFAETVQEGISALRAHGIEVMVVDMQYSPDAASVINFMPYLDALHHAGDLADAYVFRRYDVMKYWSDEGIFHLTDVPKDQRRALAARVYACLGERLADAIAYASQ